MDEYICPNCNKPIYDEDALLCHFCGGSLKRSGKRLLGKMKYSGPNLIYIIVTLIIIFSFIVLFF